MKINLNLKSSDVAKLIDKKFLFDFLTSVLNNYYSDFEKIYSLETEIYKRHYRGPRRYNFVMGCQLELILAGQKQKKYIFIGANADYSKKVAYENLMILRRVGFDHGNLTVTAPIAYIPELRAIIYEGAPGQSLFKFLKQDSTSAQLLKPLELAAQWLHKLHLIDISNFRQRSLSKYSTDNLLISLKKNIPHFTKFSAVQGQKLSMAIEKITLYSHNFDKLLQPHLVYGDYHPENIILESLESRRLTMIDLTDLSLGDCYRDVGTFIQQFDFMAQPYLPRRDINNLKMHFVASYFKQPFHLISPDDIHRINLYQALTAIRSATWLFYYSNALRASLDLLNDSLLLLDKIDRSENSINLR